MSKDLCFIDLQIYLKEILISHSVLNSEIHPENEVQKVKDGYRVNYSNVIFNNRSSKDFFITLDIIEKKVIEEIDFNKEIGNKPELDEYLFNLSDYLKTYLNNFVNNKDTNKINCESIKVSNGIEGFNLNKDYLDEIAEFKRTLLNKLYDFQSKLIKIPEYFNVLSKNQRSISGNKKIEWNKNINQLVGFFFKLYEQGIISTDKDNLYPFLLNNFSHKGQGLNEYTLKTYFDPNKEIEKLPKANKEINPKDFLD